MEDQCIIERGLNMGHRLSQSDARGEERARYVLEEVSKLILRFHFYDPSMKAKVVADRYKLPLY